MASPRCPDGGYCGHACAFGTCFRVKHCSPLSGVYANDEWPTTRERKLTTPEVRDKLNQLEAER